MLAHSHPQTVRKQNKPLGRKRNLVQSCLKLSLNNRKHITHTHRERQPGNIKRARKGNVHFSIGISQARKLEWVDVSPSKGSS